jgi:hypothetical protein
MKLFENIQSSQQQDQLAGKIASQILKMQANTATRLNDCLNACAKRTLKIVLITLFLTGTLYCAYLIISAFIHL